MTHTAHTTRRKGQTSMFDPASDIPALEHRALRAWPALETRDVDGWLLRAARGFTKRANSANALGNAAPLAAVLDRVEAFYAGRGLPTIFRLSPLAPPDADSALGAAGYALCEPSLVMTASLAAAAAAPAAIELSRVASARCLDGAARIGGRAADRVQTHVALLRGIRAPTWFAGLRQDGAMIACAMGVCDTGAIGLFDIAVHPDHRGQGHGRAITRALLAQGWCDGARMAYLQVGAGNGVAQTLYRSLGFAEAYGYHYRVRPSPAG